MDEFEENLRQRLMAGLLAPAVEQLVLYYMYGKPVERIEVKDRTPQLAHLTNQELAERALVIAERAKDDDPPPTERPAPPSPSPEGAVH